MSKHHYIYRITNTVTGKFYIGMHTTSNPNDGYFGSGKVLKRSINKYGREKHTKEILFTANSRSELVQREKEIINEDLLADPLCMNIRLGGEGGGGWTREQQRENNKKSQLALQQLWKNEEWSSRRKKHAREFFAELRKQGRIPMPKPHKTGEFKHTNIAKQKISNANSILQRGCRNSQYGTCWIFNPLNHENKKIHQDDLDVWIARGWVKGRKLKTTV